MKSLKSKFTLIYEQIPSSKLIALMEDQSTDEHRKFTKECYNYARQVIKMRLITRYQSYGEDIANDALFELYKSYKSYDSSIARFHSWFTQLIINRANHRLRKLKNQNRVLVLFTDCLSSRQIEANFGFVFAAKLSEFDVDAQDFVCATKKKLGWEGDRNSKIIDLRHMGYTYKEIAAIYGVSKHTVIKIIKKFKAELKSGMEKLNACGDALPEDASSGDSR